MTISYLDEIKSSVEWLKNCRPSGDDEEFLESVIDNWSKSYKYRCLESKLDETFEDMIREFPILKSPHGFTLVSDSSCIKIILHLFLRHWLHLLSTKLD